ncbi:MAG: polyprenyl synthetase family protein, partial [Chthonomonadales bacterium]
ELWQRLYTSGGKALLSSATFVTQGPETSATTFLDFVRPDLEAVEARLDHEIDSDVKTVYALSGHILSAGGKRLRPAMVCLSARAVCDNPDVSRLTTVAAAVELVHMATLVHDDVVDNTATRRGKPTANAVFGNGVAVLSGDFLLARSMRLLAIDGDLKIIRTVSEITIEMSEGEVMEIMATGDPRIQHDHYYEILRKKTAVFVEGCCRCGAVLAGATEEQENCLAEYGYRLGMAFQIADDLLDYTGDPNVTGKPIGSDLRDGRATLPFMMALESASSEDRERLLAAFGNVNLSDAAVSEIVHLLDKYDVFEQTRVVAREHVEMAESSLKMLSPSVARTCFEALTQYVVQRDR